MAGLEYLGERVRARCKAEGLSQEALARRADVSLNVVGRIELGRILDPHYLTLAGLAKALGTSVAELAEDPPPSELEALERLKS